MSLSPVLPSQRVRTAIINRLADPTSGFNPYLAAVCAAYSVDPFTIHFADDSANFLEGKYSIEKLIEKEEVDLPLITIYQGPSRANTIRDRVVQSTFSGEMVFGLDIHLMSYEGQSQSQFDKLVSASHDALVNTFNDRPNGPITWATQKVLWNGNVAMGQPSRIINTDTELYLSTLPFALTFTVVS